MRQVAYQDSLMALLGGYVDSIHRAGDKARIGTLEGCKMPKCEDYLAALRAVTQRAKFNNWLGLEVVSASDGEVELHLAWREEFGQYAGYLHAGIRSFTGYRLRLCRLHVVGIGAGVAAFRQVPAAGNRQNIHCKGARD
jgi:hypothetical protein